jgi:hypothetical protein
MIAPVQHGLPPFRLYKKLRLSRVLDDNCHFSAAVSGFNLIG